MTVFEWLALMLFAAVYAPTVAVSVLSLRFLLRGRSLPAGKGRKTALSAYERDLAREVPNHALRLYKLEQRMPIAERPAPILANLQGGRRDSAA